MLRVPDAGRVEDRCVDGSANPYLALGALIAAGLDGIDRNVDPGEPCELNLLGYRERSLLGRAAALPLTLWHALEHLEDDAVLREGLGKTPEGDYLDYFVATKRAEFRASHAKSPRGSSTATSGILTDAPYCLDPLPIKTPDHRRRGHE